MEEGSYLMIERGMPVRGTDGDLGTVDQVIADVAADVFRGFIMTSGFLPSRQHFLVAEHVVSVSEGAVRVDISRGEAEALPGPSAASPSLAR